MLKYIFIVACILLTGTINAQEYQNEAIESKFDSSDFSAVKEMTDSLIKNNKCDIEAWYFKAKSEIKSKSDKSLTPYESVLMFEKCYREYAAGKRFIHNNNIMLSDTRFMDLFYVIGLRYSKEKDYNHSAEWYNLARFRYKDDAFFNMELGLSNLAIKNYNIAILAFEKVVQIDSCDARAYYNLACSLSLSEDKISAIKYLSSAIRFDKKYRAQALIDADLEYIRSTKEFTEITK